jgi:hypothetical protein
MNYRPQFDTETPAGFEDEEYLYSFDITFPPLLAGQEALAFPLLLQSDEEFYIQSIGVVDVSGVLGVRFRDSFGNALSEDFAPATDYASEPGCNLEPALFCRGGVLLVDLKNIA